MSSFTFNGHSSTEYGLIVEHIPEYPIPERVVDTISVRGRNGDLVVDTGAYANVSQVYHVYFNTDNTTYNARMNSAAMWLYGARGYKRLEDTYDTSIYRKAMVNLAETANNFRNKHGRFDITFNCKPQRYLKSGETEVAVVSGATVVNSYMPCYPIFTVTGNGNLNVNGNIVTISNNSGDTITIDCETQNAYKGTTNRNSDIVVTGDFPYLKSGNNVITFDTTTVKMIPNWWTL